MRIILVLAVVFYFFWILKGRGIYIIFKYREETGFEIDSNMDRENLMSKLKAELKFPNLKEINYNEQGQISLLCKYGAYSLKLENEMLFVRKDNLGNNPKKIEEAECLKAYIEKLFNPDSENNPREMYNNMKGSRKKSVIAGIVLVCAIIALLAFSAVDSGVTDAVASKNISASYLTAFSDTETVGEAFDDFFDNPKWTSYSQGAQEYVDFSGGCVYGDNDNAKMIITFALNNNSFEVTKITVDGKEMPIILHHEILETIYEE